MATLRDLFIGDPKWNRPTPGANRCVVQAGTACCICVPSTATRVVVEMWGQGGGGDGASCCSWGRSGGQGGSYASKVWSGSTAPACTGQAMCFCGCVCACDCKVPGCTGTCCGHPGQFSRLTNCNTLGGAGIGSWIGCATGGAGGMRYCDTTLWPCCGNPALDCNRRFDTCCVQASASTNLGYYNICGFSCAQNSACDGGSLACCTGASCYCATGYCSATCVGAQHRTCELSVCFPATTTCGFDGVFVPVSCSCFDVYRLGACGFTINTNLGYSSFNFCHLGNGGAAFAGGAQQLNNFSLGNYAYCGWAGNFPGGGGKSAGACGGGCCCGSIGGGGVILVSWDV